MKGVCLLIALTAQAATLDGTVNNSATGAPVKKARVTVRGPDGFYNAISDTSGRWSISSIPDGDYELAVDCQGFSPPPSRRPPVRIPDDRTVALELSPLAVLFGKVLDEAGDPLPAVTVSALAYDYSRPAPTLRVATKASTDDRGEFRIFDLRPGRYYIQAASSNRAHAILYHGGATDAAQASPLDLAPGAETGGIDFRMRTVSLFQIRGRLVDGQTGQPLRAVVVAEASGAPSARYSAQSDADGSFTIPRVRPGTYQVSVTQNTGRPLWAEQTVVLAGRDADGLQLTGIPSADVPGIVVLDGPPPAKPLNLRVTLDPAERPSFSETALPKPDNTFTLTAGPLLFAVQVLGIPPELYLREIRFGAEDASAGRVDLRRGPAPLTLTLAANPGRISGTVETAAGKPAPGTLVAITPADPAIRRYDLTRTLYADSDGRFQAQSLAPGDYHVFAWAQFETALVGSLEFRRLLGAKSTTVTVRAGSQESIRLHPISEADVRDARRRLP